MQKTRLRRYARLIARTGVNVQKGQDVFLFAGLEQPEFVEMVTDELYKAGARKVFVRFSHQPLQRLNMRHGSLRALSTVETFEEAELKYMAEHQACRLFLESEDPDGLKGINLEKLSRSQQARYPVIKPYREQMEGRHQWCIAAVPGAAWAKKVFPGERTSRAMEKLWEAILETSRVDEDPIAAWQAHDEDLLRRCEVLNGWGIESLHYRAGNGTDLQVGMIPQAMFCGGGERTASGVFFNPNIPTEECFVSPMRGQAEGVVHASKPLSYQGQLIEDFWFRFEGGRVVEAHAGKNDALLQKMIGMDEGARYLGECALVPFDSPINRTGLIFYNTLFDENACCHLALGKGFADTIRDGQEMTPEQIRALGVNDSMIHEDFMIGTPDLSITAKCRDGMEREVFRNGTWAF